MKAILIGILASLLVALPANADDVTDGCSNIWEVGRWFQEGGPDLYIIGLVCEKDGVFTPVTQPSTEADLRLQLARSRAEVVFLRNENARLISVMERIRFLNFDPGRGDDSD